MEDSAAWSLLPPAILPHYLLATTTTTTAAATIIRHTRYPALSFRPVVET